MTDQARKTKSNRIGDLGAWLKELQLQENRLYEQIEAVEHEETSLKNQFGRASDIGKRRIVSQVLRLRSDGERKKQLRTMLAMQMRVIETQLHNLAIQLQGENDKSPTQQELESGRAGADKAARRLGVKGKVERSVVDDGSGRTAEEQSVYDELARTNKKR